MVLHLIVENFGKVQFADIELSNMVVLVGNNNSGKTMLMQLIYGIQKKLVDLQFQQREVKPRIYMVSG